MKMRCSIQEVKMVMIELNKIVLFYRKVNPTGKMTICAKTR